MKPIKQGTSKAHGDYFDDYELSTGKILQANNSIIGISPELNVSEGYDGGGADYDLTKEEKIEVADYMISQWRKYKKKVKEE